MPERRVRALPEQDIADLKTRVAVLETKGEAAEVRLNCLRLMWEKSSTALRRNWIRFFTVAATITVKFLAGITAKVTQLFNGIQSQIQSPINVTSVGQSQAAPTGEDTTPTQQVFSLTSSEEETK
ncbi:MAG: hypothetical protein M0T74_04030 [Desulfitobacterium hafniense]|nr:hypothetical protein [Desulfitobacterium hafniense]